MKTKAEELMGKAGALSNSRKAVQLVLKLGPVEILTTISTTSRTISGFKSTAV